MSSYYDTVRFLARGNTSLVGLANHDDLIEHHGSVGGHSLQAITEDAYNALTPKTNPDSQEHVDMASYHDNKVSTAHDMYDTNMSTPPLSPSTTISSLHTDGYAEHYYSHSQDSLPQREEREEVRKGKQPEVPSSEEMILEDDPGQEDADWYGMQYALERSRMDGAAMWPQTAGEGSTSDAAFVAMYDGYIHPEDLEYWYAHWCKWHHALAREEKRRRDRAASDASYTRAYHHATYVQWEQSQRKKYMQPAHANTVGPKPMTSSRNRSRNRYRASTCLF